MASNSNSIPKFPNDSQSIPRLIQSITVNIQKISQNGFNLLIN